MGAVDLEAILSNEDAEVYAVLVPEWGGTVHFRTLTADRRDRWELEYQNQPGFRAALVGLSMCDEHGQWAEPTPTQIQALGQKAAGPMERCITEILKRNAIREVDLEEMEAELKKTSGGDSGSSSQSYTEPPRESLSDR